ncbi:MAG: hypothetical protein AAF432_00475 [Planctomycetota bacterium]
MKFKPYRSSAWALVIGEGLRTGDFKLEGARFHRKYQRGILDWFKFTTATYFPERHKFALTIVAGAFGVCFEAGSRMAGDAATFASAFVTLISLFLLMTAAVTVFSLLWTWTRMRKVEAWAHSMPDEIAERSLAVTLFHFAVTRVVDASQGLVVGITTVWFCQGFWDFEASVLLYVGAGLVIMGIVDAIRVPVRSRLQMSKAQKPMDRFDPSVVSKLYRPKTKR